MVNEVKLKTYNRMEKYLFMYRVRKLATFSTARNV
jgi:hypothetical protein